MDYTDELPDIFKNASCEPVSSSEQKSKAQAVISDLSAQYPSWAKTDVQKLKHLYVEACRICGQNRDELVRGSLYRTAHDIKGQGATFGYPLMTLLGAHLCAYIKKTTEFSDENLTTLLDDINDMEIVLEQKLIGDGGDAGKQILNRLKAAG
ncbi:MAG: hypothetical protein IKY98_05815 [Alphaproteobacteria bacterium]|nr:hypothetical protein [Alphaproteobacteria bacterium]